jgi:hypothetical protein
MFAYVSENVSESSMEKKPWDIIACSVSMEDLLLVTWDGRLGM